MQQRILSLLSLLLLFPHLKSLLSPRSLLLKGRGGCFFVGKEGRNGNAEVRSIKDFTESDASKGLFYAIAGAVSCGLSAAPSAAARQGAFEMDVELYVKNLVGGNKGRPNSGRRTPLPTPRRLDTKFAMQLLEAVDAKIGQISGIEEKEIEKRVKELLPLTLQYFREFVPVGREDLSDQYYFDIVVFLHYLVAKEAIPGSKEVRVA